MPLKQQTYNRLWNVNFAAALTGWIFGPLLSIALCLNKESIPESIYVYTQAFAWIYHYWSYGPFMLVCWFLAGKISPN